MEIEKGAKIFTYSKPVDMRKSFQFVYTHIAPCLKAQRLVGAYFVFMNASRTIVKVLYNDGYSLQMWYKRLMYGEFPSIHGMGEITNEQLREILSGIQQHNIMAM